MLKIYGFIMSSRANKVLMCANALGLNYEYVNVNLPEGQHKTKEFLALNPVGKVPVMDDEGFYLFESTAIMKYLCRKSNSEYYPKDLNQQAKVDQWCDFISIHVGVHFTRVTFNKIIAEKVGMEVDKRAIKEGMGFIDQFLSVFENQLQKTKYVASDELSIADLSLLAEMDPSEMIGIDLKKYPTLTAWRETLRSQKFYQKVHKFFGESMMKK